MTTLKLIRKLKKMVYIFRSRTDQTVEHGKKFPVHMVKLHLNELEEL